MTTAPNAGRIIAGLRQCEVCIQKHGPGCAATHTDGSGRDVCVFCLDQVLCPTMKRFLHLQQLRSTTSQEEKALNHENAVSTDAAAKASGKTNGHAIVAGTAPGPRCKVAECIATLSPRNESGYCSRHFHRSEAKKMNGRGSAAARAGKISEKTKIAATITPKVTPIAATAPNSNSTEDYTSEARLNSVLIGWPLEQKLKAVNAWLTAAI